MEDSPGLQVRDRLFDSPADFVEGGIELFFPVEEFAMRWLSDRSDHAQAEIAFVADPVAGIDLVQNARTAQRRTVVAATFDGVGDPAQPARQVADHLEVQSGGVVLAGVQLRVILPAPAAGQGAIDDELLLAREVLGGRGERTHHPRQLRCDRGDRPRDRRLRYAVVLRQFLLHMISPQIGQRDHNGLEQAQNWRITLPARTDTGRMNKRAQLGDLVFAEACSMVHAAGRRTGNEWRNSSLPKYGPSPYSPRRRESLRDVPE